MLDRRPLLIDLCCGAGGAAKGYQRAGFHVLGIDNKPQPNYCGDQFIQGDVIDFLKQYTWVWTWHPVAFHASPPCQAWSDLQKQSKRVYVDLIEDVRQELLSYGKPYVIENVEGAPLRDPVTLCGTMFPGLRVLRHRLFEASFPLVAPPHGKHPLVFTHDKRKAHHGKLDQDTSFVQVTGGGNCTVSNKRAAMGIDWMTGKELNEAIPPAYTGAHRRLPHGRDQGTAGGSMRNREDAIRAIGKVLWPHKGDVNTSPPLRAKVEAIIEAYEALPDQSTESESSAHVERRSELGAPSDQSPGDISP